MVGQLNMSFTSQYAQLHQLGTFIFHNYRVAIAAQRETNQQDKSLHLESVVDLAGPVSDQMVQDKESQVNNKCLQQLYCHLWWE